MHVSAQLSLAATGLYVCFLISWTYWWLLPRLEERDERARQDAEGADGAGGGWADDDADGC